MGTSACLLPEIVCIPFIMFVGTALGYVASLSTAATRLLPGSVSPTPLHGLATLMKIGIVRPCPVHFAQQCLRLL